MSTPRQPSLFAQKMKALRDAHGISVSGDCVPVVPKEMDCVAGVDMDVVRSENEALLNNMSRSEIEEKQGELLRILSPESIAFLKNRTNKKKIEGKSLSPESNKLEISKIKGTCERTDQLHELNIGSECRIDGIPRSVGLESEKMKWMEDVPISLKPLPDKLYNARFNFEGELLPYIIENESTISKGLYHHGDEPERPGYTFEELFQLSRSSFPRQRVVALNTIAAILENEYLLSSNLETKLLSELLDSGIFLILRFALDERLKSIYLAALRAMSALLWRAVDMHYLTDAVGVFGDMRLPSFEVNNSTLDGANLKEMKDSEMLSLDVIKGSLRTNLIQRLKYILDDMYPVDERVLPIIKCLTRIAYHSNEAVREILDTPLLLEKLFSICRLPSEFEKSYTAKLLILFRVIACRSQEFAETLCTRFHLVSYLLDIIGDSVTKTTTVSQCIYLWHVLLYYDIAVESVSEFSPVLFNLLRQQAIRTSEHLEEGDLVLANAFVTLFIFLFEKFAQNVTFYRPDLEQLCRQWLNLFAKGEQTSRNFIKLISNSTYLLTCANLVEKREKLTSIFQMALWNRLIPLSEKLHGASYLLNAVKTNYVDSLPSLCVPSCILVEESNFLLMHAVVKCSLNNDFLDNCEEHATLINNVWRTYVLPILDRPYLNQITSLWPARMEIMFLYDLLFLNSRRKSQSDQQQRELLRLAFGLLRIIHTDDSALIQPIFNEILFSKHLQDQITSSNFDVVKEPSNDDSDYLNIVKKIFVDQLYVPNTKAALMSTKRGTECAMPTDWFYVPILKISNTFQDDSRRDPTAYENANNTKIMDCILRWIRFVEYIADDVKTEMSLATRFCRVCCVFLCGDVFLELNNLLSDILRLLMRFNDRLEFNSPIPGLPSFYDFYRELCEQFASCSYGDRVFGRYLLVPLQQKHDVRLRLYFWSEQTVTLRFFTMTDEQLPVPLDSYLQPHEKNVHLIETYLNVIAKGQVNERISPALYHIGVQHIASFLRLNEEEAITKRLRQKVDRIGNECLKNCILNYGHIL